MYKESKRIKNRHKFNYFWWIFTIANSERWDLELVKPNISLYFSDLEWNCKGKNEISSKLKFLMQSFKEIIQFKQINYYIILKEWAVNSFNILYSAWDFAICPGTFPFGSKV